MTRAAEDLIPEQEGGVSTNTESSVEFDNVQAARDFFRTVRDRLLDVNHWHDLAGKGTADFRLTDAHGAEVIRKPQKGDHFRIDIPGPGPVTGDGYDWVQIEEVEEKEDEQCQTAAIRVRPATNPTNERQDIAHFFSDEATSNFIVTREGKRVTAGVYGRNEKPNTTAETVRDKARNTTIATGAISGFSKLQWKSLVNGLVKK